MIHRISLALAFFLFAGAMTSFAQKSVPAVKTMTEHVDTRIDNMEYWMEMAKKGLTPFNPDHIPAPAVYKGSRIATRGILTTNSPDVPVTTLTTVTESENSVFIDPNNANYILNSNNSTTWTGSAVGSVLGANYFQSSNAGIGWSGSTGGAGGTNKGDPTTAIGLNGREYVNFISSASGQGIAYSDDGSTWSTATVAPNPGSLADKNHMWIDNKATSPYEGNLYVAWTDFGGTDDTEIKISRSVNDGASWSTPVNISSAINAGSHNQGVNIQTGPNGEVYVVWTIYDSWPSDETALGFAKSTNGGSSFGPAGRIISNIKGIRTTAVAKNHRVNSFPSMAVDISGGPYNGNIYIVWTNTGTPGVNTGTNKSVYMIRSGNGGTTWSTPVRINQGPFADGKEAYFPWISCDPETGVLTAVYYDDRNVASTQCEVYAAYSVDAGNTWTDFVVSDVAFTPSPISGLASLYMGDYLGITSKGGKVYPCWTDNRTGITMTYVSPFELGLNAAFTTGTNTICPGAAVTFTDVSTGSPSTWTWSFPGGTPSGYSGQTPPAITYSAPGTYDVSLTVSDGTSSDTETKTGYITVKNVIADFSAVPTTVIVGNAVTFTDQSSCGPATWSWNFPGGTPSTYSGPTPPPVIYSTLGTYDVSLTVTNAFGSDTKTIPGHITVTPPIFNMTNGTVTICTGDFYDSGGPTGSYQNYETFVETFYPSTPGAMIRFTFSAFSTESGYDTLTIYNGASSAAPVIGKYHGTSGPGTVTASNASGALTFRFHSDEGVTGTGWAAAISCYVDPDPPVANFSASTVTPTMGQTVTFTDLSTHTPNAWNWSFSPPTVTYTGGTSAASQHPQVQFGALGYYAVTLTATNANGSDAEVKTNYIHVTNCTYNTLPYSESFSGTAIPSCWTQVDNAGNGQIWQFGTITGYSPLPALTGNYAYLNSDAYGSGNTQNADLVSPTFNLAAYSSVTLGFLHYFRYYSGSSGKVYYSLNNGSTWNLISTFSANTDNPATFSQAISALAGQPQVKFKWNYTGTYGWYWAIDEVTVTGTCNTVPVSLAITGSSTAVCQDTPVTFTATPVNGGTVPSYQWKVNGANAGSNSTLFTYTPIDGDTVTCVLTSNTPCVTGNPATSNAVILSVTPNAEAGVTITASVNPVTTGTPVTFTATPVNGGTTPGFQWKVNATNASHATNATYTYVPADGDQVTCVMTSSETCVTGSPATSDTITMTVASIPATLTLTNLTVSGTQCFDAIQTIAAAGNGTTFLVPDGANATLVAGMNILLYPGTKVDSGGYLLGYIAPSGPFCQNATKPVTGISNGPNTGAANSLIYFKVHPNPTARGVTLTLKGKVPDDVVRVDLYNMNGERMGGTEMKDEVKRDISLAGWPAGLYLLRVSSGSHSGTERIVKID